MNSRFAIRQMEEEDVEAAARLQALAFPPPFPSELLWQPEHLRRHVKIFPKGQFVATSEGAVVGSCSNTCIEEATWQAHGDWNGTVGGPFLTTFNPEGTTLYGLDITVDPDYRRQGIGRGFYRARFELVKMLGLSRYGTGCRLPDYQAYLSRHPETTPRKYVGAVASGETTDRTLTPLLRYGLSIVDVVENYMEDRESGDAAALLEWKP